MKKELLLLLLLLAPIIAAPGTDYETPESKVNSITLQFREGQIEWESSDTSENGFKIVWSKDENPTYPTRANDKYHYYSEPEKNTDTLEAFDGTGTYYVRVCEYLGGKCGTYSNEIEIQLEEKYENKKTEENKNEETQKENSESHTQAEKCNGCQSEEKCYPLGYRINGEFCSNNQTLILQLTEESPCENNFECESNVCVSGECISSGFIRKIIDWFKKLF